LDKQLVGEAAWKILVEIGDRVQSEKLIARLKREARGISRYLLLDPESCWRDIAATLLGTVGNRNDWFVLKQSFMDPFWMMRCAAYSSTASIGWSQQFRYLIRCSVVENIRLPGGELTSRFMMLIVTGRFLGYKKCD
jgi:hypothetical protein